MKILQLLQTVLFTGLSVAAMAQAPANDDCAGAISMSIAADELSCLPTTVSTVGATQSAEANSCSATWFDDDVWYTFTTGATLPDSIIVTGMAGTVTNWGMAIYQGCGGAVLGCFSGGARGLRLPSSAYLPNTTYVVRCWAAGVGAATQGDFDMCAFGAMLPAVPIAALSSPKAFSFGNVGMPSPATVSLNNVGGMPLTVASVTSSSPLFAVSMLSAGATIAVGGTQAFDVTYTADNFTDDSTTVTINTNGGNVMLKVKGYAYGQGMVYETFDMGLPASFMQYDVDGDGNGFFGYNASHSGDSCIASASWKNNVILTPDNYLVLPQMTPRAGNNTFSFFTAAQDPAFPAEHYEVNVSTTDNQATSFTTSLFNETLANNLWHEVRVDLSAYNNQSIYLAIRHFNVTDMFYIKFDNFRFPDYILATETPNTTAAALKTTPNPSNGNFNISWDAAQTDVTIRIADAQGREIANVRPAAGAVSTDLFLGNIASGVYSVRLSGSQGVQTTKLTIVK